MTQTQAQTPPPAAPPEARPAPDARAGLGAWLRMLWVVVGLELRQRVRSVAWYVLLGVVALVVGGVIVVLWLSLQGYQRDIGGAIFATTIFLVMLVTSLVTPALSGNAINGDREAGTLASTQVTQVSATQLVLGKVVGSWIASLGFLAVCVPFMLAAAALGGLRPEAVLVSIPIVVLEIGVVSAIGVGLSGVIRKPVLSTVVSYLVVATFAVGTLIGFGVATIALQSEEQRPELTWEYDETTGNATCIDTGRTYETVVPRTDRVWWMLAANPYVILADATPPHFDSGGYPDDLFGQIALMVRMAQEPPHIESCADYDARGAWEDPAEGVFDRTAPSWFVGMAIHVGLAALATWGAIVAVRAPARTLAPGSRIA
ncbi:ABC transporter permease [Agrococcus carbonis]|uniref:ABC-type transport system involved in multi-copper enzyme maturation, permease component n=1 Tax=Agrococcus carbonis TaxID=684552 RepID=A0A1H1Q9M8_9MICO|nr:ABC transporter permease [Agrococcus carbonis]SDS20145.1 ABC-type transport system involved in multi-copper enzyme maturation, permease component [Agrococcus carbonis]